MASHASPRLWDRIDLIEQSLCLQINGSCRYPGVQRFFAVVSRLGDGGVWYLLMLALAVSGPPGARIAAQLALTAIAAVLIYKQLKHRLVRERPCVTHAGIHRGVAPLDRYSFPSGHTLHAVSFTIVTTAHAPELAPILVPFTLLVAASRVVLGLHYPTDVVAGAVIGTLLASVSLSVWPV